MREGRSALVHTMAPSVVTSPVCTPCVRTGRPPAADATPGTPAASTPAPTAPARNTVRLLTRSFVMGAF
jgi:hypothetical protein